MFEAERKQRESNPLNASIRYFFGNNFPHFPFFTFLIFLVKYDLVYLILYIIKRKNGYTF